MKKSTFRRGRIAPSPTGYLHLGHAITFSRAHKQMREKSGTLVFRMEDLDGSRCKIKFKKAAIEDLKWWGITWDEGPDVGGPFEPYEQSKRLSLYQEVWSHLLQRGVIYPSPHSRKDIETALRAPNEGDLTDPVFPKELRQESPEYDSKMKPGEINWRFRVPEGEKISFTDSFLGEVSYLSGTDFGDFVVWRKDGYPSYELAVVADDHAMMITDVLRGEDLALSTARQLLIYRALGWSPPKWHHAPLVRDSNGRRLAKRHKDLSIRTLRDRNWPSGKIPVEFQPKEGRQL